MPVWQCAHAVTHDRTPSGAVEMGMKHLFIALALLTGAPRGYGADIDTILRDRVVTRKKTVGIVVGVVTPESTTFHHYGSFDKTLKRPVDEHTLFRVASATKVFTSVLLADMAERGELHVDDPAANFIPSGAKLPLRNGKPITLRDLATHRSGLPAMPGNYDDRREYTERELYEFLAS